jgi:hypothetical protein
VFRTESADYRRVSLYYVDMNCRNRCSSVSVETRVQTGQSGFNFRQEQGFFPLRHRVLTGSRVQLETYPCITVVLSAGVKRPGRGAVHSPPTSVEVKNAWNCTSTTPYVRLHGVVRR